MKTTNCHDTTNRPRVDLLTPEGASWLNVISGAPQVESQNYSSLCHDDGFPADLVQAFTRFPLTNLVTLMR